MEKGRSKTNLHRLKRYGEVCQRIKQAGLVPPIKEYQVRPLYRLLDADQATVWKMALAEYALEQITPHFVDRMVTKFLQEKLEKMLARPTWGR